jgi:hypothetical protein
MIKSFAGAVVGGTLISTGFVVSASSPRANRETGTAPVLNGLSGFTGDTTTTIVRRRFERRTAD